MAIKDLYPSIRPILDLNFAGTRTVDPRITFTRASTATYFDEFGVMCTAPANTPRIDFDPVTRECKGLLIEEQRTNLLTYSDQFDTAVWAKINATVTANATTAPDGTMTVDKFETTGGGGASYLYQGRTLTQGQPYTLSVHVKNISGSGEVWLRDFTEIGIARFDIVNMAIVSSEGIASNLKIVNYGNGWCRISAVFTPTIATENHNLSCVHPSSPLAGNAFYAWGAQLEDGSFPTSYIKTEGSQVTRASDIASMSGVNFSSWYNQSEGTLFADAVGVNNISGATRRFAEISNNGSAGNRYVLGYGTTSGTRFLTVTDGSAQVDITAFAIAGTTVKMAAAYKSNSFQQATNGVTGVEDTSGNVPVVNQLVLGGYDPALSTALNGHISRIAYYPKRLSNINLQAITT